MSQQDRLWVEVSIQTTPIVAELCADFLLNQGCQGVVNDEISLEDNPQIELYPGQSLPTRSDVVAKGYFPYPYADLDVVTRELNEIIVRSLLMGLPTGIGQVDTRLIAEEDWAENWKQYFHPTRVGRRLVIKPSWEDYDPAPADVILELDPGMAFGTGTHPTTQLCLIAIEDLVAEYFAAGKSLPPAFDIGTGSGILTIAAVKLGFPQVVAIDIDSLATQVAAENFVLSGTADAVTVLTGSIEAIEGQASVILCNILAEAIAAMAPALAERLAPGGRIITSGIIVEREQLVRDALTQAGLHCGESRYLEGWVMLPAEKKV